MLFEDDALVLALLEDDDESDGFSPPVPRLPVAVELDEPPPPHPSMQSLNPSTDGNRQLAPTRATVVSMAAHAMRRKRKDILRA
ncbi:Hypothetical protein A7982_05773 [Minicystis rosea]|nr:Hypothetical protein A7982_05773 [Minicystis rosea]